MGTYTLQHIHSTWPEESHVPKSERPASRSTSSTLQKLSSSSPTRRKQASEQSKAKQWWDGSLFHRHPAAWRHRAGWQAKMTEGTHERETRELSLLSFTNDTYLIPAPTVIPCTAYGPASVSPSQAYSVSATQ